MKAISHVIFDLDGLLIDSESLYTEMFEEICQQFGCHYSIETKRKQMGKKPDEGLQILIDEYNLPVTVDQLRPIASRAEEKYLPRSKLQPGAQRLLEHLSSYNIPMCIASGSSQLTFDWKMRKHPDIVAKMSHMVLAGSDPEVQNGKPAPDCFLVAAKRFASPPECNKNALVFEDASNGVRAGLAAGMHVIWVPSIPESDDVVTELSNHENVTILESLDEFKPEAFGLPPMNERCCDATVAP